MRVRRSIFVFCEGEAAVVDYAADVGVGGEERGDVVRGFVADAAVGAAFALGAFDDVPEREPVGEDEAVARVEAGVGRFAPCAVDYFPEFILRVRVVACFGERADAGQRAEYQYFEFSSISGPKLYSIARPPSLCRSAIL